jgi:hypothetical protein
VVEPSASDFLADDGLAPLAFFASEDLLPTQSPAQRAFQSVWNGVRLCAIPMESVAMMEPESLPESCNLQDLHEWLIRNEPSFQAYLDMCGIQADDLAETVHDLPSIRVSRASWQNSRPLPSDAQLLLLSLLLSPGRRLARLDEETLGYIEVALCIMALPDAVPASVEIDLTERRFDFCTASAMAQSA